MTNAILFAPHNDDESLFASFFILKYRPDVIICLQSRKQGEGTHKVSNKETSFAMKNFGVYHEIWPYWDDDPDWSLIDHQICNTIEQYDTIIYPAHCVDGNEQHNKIYNMIEYQRHAKYPDKEFTKYTTYGYPSGRQQGTHELKPEPEWIPLKLHAISCYKSQIEREDTREHFMRSIKEYYG